MVHFALIKGQPHTRLNGASMQFAFIFAHFTGATTVIPILDLDQVDWPCVYPSLAALLSSVPPAVPHVH